MITVAELESIGSVPRKPWNDELRDLGDKPGHVFHGNQWTKYGRTTYGPPATTVADAKRRGYTEGPFYHSSDFTKEIEDEGFRSKGAEYEEIVEEGGIEEFKKWGTADPVMFARDKKDVIEDEEHGAYGSEVIMLYAKPGTVKSAEGMTLLGGLYVTDPRHVIPIRGSRESARMKQLGDKPGHPFHGNQYTNVVGQFFAEHTGPIVGIGPNAPHDVVSWTGEHTVPIFVGTVESAIATARHDGLQTDHVTCADDAATAERFAEIMAKHLSAGTDPAVLKIDVPEDVADTFITTKTEGLSELTGRILPQWITGAFISDNNLGVIEWRAAAGTRTIYLPIFAKNNANTRR